MEIKFAKPQHHGVDTLVYVGDDAASIDRPAMPSNRALGAGAIGAALALFAKGTISRVAGAAVAGYIGYQVYQARR